MDLEPDLAEPAAELLRRVAPNGVAIEMLPDTVRVRAWLPDDGELPDRRGRLDEGFWHLGQIQSFPEPEYKLVKEEPWEVAWKEHYQPLEVGERLQILPSWMKQESGTRIPIYLEPGMAFGSGAHTTTRHCLEALELHVTADDFVADLGCGSGILAIAAARLGAGRVVALDIDLQAVKLARENVLRNRVADRVQVMLGSMAELETAGGSRGFDLIVANIQASVLEDLIQTGVSGYLASGGRVVMSGILKDQLDSLVDRGNRGGLFVERTLITGDWHSIVFERR